MSSHSQEFPTPPDDAGTRAVPHPRPGKIEVLRSRFIAGLITVIPAMITIWAIMIMADLLNSNVGTLIDPIVRAFLDLVGWPLRLAAPLTISVSLFLTLLFILAVGVLSRFFLVRRLIRLGERIVERIPLVRFFYVTPREVLRTLTAKRDSVKRVVALEYPRRGIWCIAYATGEIHLQPGNRKIVTVFLPTTPNPTSGFLLMVPAEDVHDINLTTEDAVRFIISGGILSPNSMHTAPFNGLETPPKLPPPEPLTVHLPNARSEEEE